MPNAAAPPQPQSLASERAENALDTTAISAEDVEMNEPQAMPKGKKRKKRIPPKEPMRGNIACLRCRRSKVRCENDRGTRSCDYCIKAGIECIYGEAQPSIPRGPGQRKPDALSPTSAEQDGSETKKLRKDDDLLGTEIDRGTAYAQEVLSHDYLSPHMWDEILGIYKVHYSTELPFLHLPSLKEGLDRGLKERKFTSPKVNLVLLGVLALTARFHNNLSRYVTASYLVSNLQANQVRKGPLDKSTAASEVYADALTTALGPLKVAMSVPSVERVQAFLMLALYEWSKAEEGGFAAWMYLGNAIRMAQAMRLGFGDKPTAGRANPPWPRTSSAEGSPPSLEQIAVEKEVRRRTMFSCLILDRMLSHGQGREFMIRSEDLEIQLPCTEVDFDLSKIPYTGFLNPAKGDIHRPNNDDSVLSRFIRLVHIWGKISQYSFAGGRLTEGQNPPWQEGTVFRTLREELHDFYAELPEAFQMSRQNYYGHDNHHATSAYVSFHMLGCLCQIMLHREYIPFIPIRCSGPVGPLDPPTFPPEIVPTGFWEDSAELVFKAAGQIVELIDLCQDKLPRSSIVLFAIWTAAFDGLYARHFPHMDRRHYMVSEEEVEARQKGEVLLGRPMATDRAWKAIEKLAQHSSMASTYLGRFARYDAYFSAIVSEHHKYRGVNQKSPGVSLRLGGGGGGLDEWKLHGGMITNNGSILVEADSAQHPGSDNSRASTLERGSSADAESQTATWENVVTPTSATSLAFTAINSNCPPPRFPAQAGRPGNPTAGEKQEDPRVDAHRATKASPQQVPSQLLKPSSATGEVSCVPASFDLWGDSWENIERFLTAKEGERIGDALNDMSEFCGVSGSYSFADLTIA